MTSLIQFSCGYYCRYRVLFYSVSNKFLVSGRWANAACSSSTGATFDIESFIVLIRFHSLDPITKSQGSQRGGGVIARTWEWAVLLQQYTRRRIVRISAAYRLVDRVSLNIEIYIAQIPNTVVKSPVIHIVNLQELLVPAQKEALKQFSTDLPECNLPASSAPLPSVYSQIEIQHPSNKHFSVLRVIFSHTHLKI